MRLFYAIDLDEKTRDLIQQATEPLRRQAKGGRWMRIENLHLTLVFLGETEPDQLQLLSEILQEAACSIPAFTLTFSGYGTFGRHGEILWMGVSNEPYLQQLVSTLRLKLTSHQKVVDMRPYKPHLTLARQVQPVAKAFSFDGPPILYPVQDVVLMESLRKEGHLIYRPIYRTSLKSDGDQAIE